MSNKDGASGDVDVCDVNDMLQNMSTGGNEFNGISVCANCGKEVSSDNMNTCNKCKVTTYCNAVCKKVHKKKHKKQCEEHQRLATEKHNEELRRAAELHDIELFKQPPPEGDCPICFLLLPTLETGRRYQGCCGKFICCGCIHAPLYDNQGNEVDNKKCPFCRTPTTHEKEAIERSRKRAKAGDPVAICNEGNCYSVGIHGYPQDYTKALELWHRAAELGNAEAYRSIGDAYQSGQGVEVDKKKAV